MSKLHTSPTEHVVATVNDVGLEKAARKFKTSPATLSRWLKAQKYRLKRIYVREEPPVSVDQQAAIKQVLQEQLEKFGLADGAEITMEDA